MAPKLCPISCATTCHSVLPAVETAVPETMDPELPVASCWHLPRFEHMLVTSSYITHKVASQAMPTSEPVGHPLIKCQRPLPSLPLLPLHWEKSERRESSAASLHGRFHGRFGSVELGQLNSNWYTTSNQNNTIYFGLCTASSTRPRLTLNVD